MSNRSSSKQHLFEGPGAERPRTSEMKKRQKAKARAKKAERNLPVLKG